MTRLILLLLLGASPAWAQSTLRGTPRDYRRLLARLGPGVTLQLEPGEYRRGLPLVGVHGSSRKPARITGGRGVVFVARPGHNTVQLTDASWIELHALTLEGRGLPVDAIKAGNRPDRPVHHVTIEGCTIRGHGENQMIVGISTKVPAWDWVIRNNYVLGAGTGLYLGNSDGSAPFIGGLIEGNVIRDCLGYLVQVKHQNPWPAMPGLPDQPRTTTIRYNVFIKNDVRGDAGDRPNVLVSGPPASGPGSRDRYEVHGNVFFHNPRESLFQGSGAISIHDNLFLDCPGVAVRLMPHHGKRPLGVRVYHNTFIRTGRPWRISGQAQGAQRVIAANLIHADDAGADRTSGDVWMDARRLRAALRRPFEPLGRLDIQPLRLLRAQKVAGFPASVKDDAAWNLDFHAEQRRQPHACGAVGRRYVRPRVVTDLVRLPELRGRRR